MNRPHRTPDQRLSALTAEDRALFADFDAQELLDHAEQLRHRAEFLGDEIHALNARRSAIEVLADRALRSVGQVSRVVRRNDGVMVRWTRHLDGTGFQRDPVSEPVPNSPVKPDAGAG